MSYFNKVNSSELENNYNYNNNYDNNYDKKTNVYIFSPKKINNNTNNDKNNNKNNNYDNLNYNNKYTETDSNIFYKENMILKNRIIIRIENYGLFVKLSNSANNKLTCLIHKKTISNFNESNFNIGDKLNIKILTNTYNKISGEILNENNNQNNILNKDNSSMNYFNTFPKFNKEERKEERKEKKTEEEKDKNKLNIKISPWNSNLDIIKKPFVIKDIKDNYVKCSDSGLICEETNIFKCCEYLDGDIYYFKKLKHIINYNMKYNKHLKILSKTNELIRLENFIEKEELDENVLDNNY